MFNIGDRVRHIEDITNNPEIGTIIYSYPHTKQSYVDWDDSGKLVYSDDRLVPVMPSEYADFQDKIKDRIG